MNRKRIITALLLIILLSIMPIISVVMMYHITLCDTLSKIDSGCFGDMNFLYKIPSAATMQEIAEKVASLPGRAAVYAEETSDGFTKKEFHIIGIIGYEEETLPA